MPKHVKSIPDGYHSLTPHLVVKGGAQAIEFYKKAFGVQELSRMDRPDGKLMHAELKIGDSIVMLADECDAPHPGHEQNCALSPTTLKGTTVGLYLYVKNAEDVFASALAAGAREIIPVTEMFWGDRIGQVMDPFGHSWSIATHTQDLTMPQIEAGAKQFLAQMGKPK